MSRARARAPRPRTAAAAAIGLACAAAAAPCATPPLARARYLMGARLEIRAFGDDPTVAAAVEEAFARVAALERAMTTWSPDGELARLNASLAGADSARRGVPVGADLARALATALDWAERTGGRFDPTVGALTEAWGLHGEPRHPSPAEIRDALGRTGHALVEVDRDGTVRCARPGVAFDLGGIGKGIALDEAAAVLRARGVRSAVLDFAGQVLALAPPPDTDGWLVDLAHPARRERPVARLRLARGSLATSSNVERGGPYGHIFDPRSGEPVVTAAAVTVLAASATAADALSKALLVAGPDAAARVAGPGADWVFLAPGVAGDAAVECVGSAGLASRLELTSSMPGCRESARRPWTASPRLAGRKEAG
jgi:thiamine biosynthesis lipoprotein